MKSGDWFRVIAVMGVSLAFLATCNYPSPTEESSLSITITEPSDGAQFVLGEFVQVRSSITYSGTDFTITLLVNDVITAGSPFSNPRTIPWVGLGFEPEEPGEYRIQTTLEDAWGHTAISDLVTVTIFEPIEIPGLVVKGTPTYTSEAASATANQDTFCWSGPSPEYKQVDNLTKGETARLVGVNADHTWLVVEESGDGLQCWVQAHQVTTNVDLESLPMVEAPPRPISTPANTKAPTKKPKADKTQEPPKYSSCSDYPDFSTCNNDPMGFGGCSWDTGLNQCQP